MCQITHQCLSVCPDLPYLISPRASTPLAVIGHIYSPQKMSSCILETTNSPLVLYACHLLMSTDKDVW